MVVLGRLLVTVAMGKLLMIASYDAYSYWKTTAAALLCAVAILHHAASPKNLKNNFIAWIGRISFSIYLVHAVVRDYLPANEIPDKLDTPSFIVVVLICSCLTNASLNVQAFGYLKSLPNSRRTHLELPKVTHRG